MEVGPLNRDALSGAAGQVDGIDIIGVWFGLSLDEQSTQSFARRRVPTAQHIRAAAGQKPDGAGTSIL